MRRPEAVTAISPRVRLRRGSKDWSEAGTMLARHDIRKNVNKKAQINVDDKGSVSEDKMAESRNIIEGVTGGALRGVCKALRATPRSVKERMKSFVKG